MLHKTNGPVVAPRGLFGPEFVTCDLRGLSGSALEAFGSQTVKRSRISDLSLEQKRVGVEHGELKEEEL